MSTIVITTPNPNTVLNTVVDFMAKTNRGYPIIRMLAYYEAWTEAMKANNHNAVRDGYAYILDLYELEIGEPYKP